jgi:cytochrome bd-type quinol oxidase subunit 2
VILWYILSPLRLFLLCSACVVLTAVSYGGVRLQDDTKTVSERCSTGAKYTAVLFALGVIVLVVGVFLQGDLPNLDTDPGVTDYLNSLLEGDNRMCQ